MQRVVNRNKINNQKSEIEILHSLQRPASAGKQLLGRKKSDFHVCVRSNVGSLLKSPKKYVNLSDDVEANLKFNVLIVHDRGMIRDC